MSGLFSDAAKTQGWHSSIAPAT